MKSTLRHPGKTVFFTLTAALQLSPWASSTAENKADVDSTWTLKINPLKPSTLEK